MSDPARPDLAALDRALPTIGPTLARLALRDVIAYARSLEAQLATVRKRVPRPDLDLVEARLEEALEAWGEGHASPCYEWARDYGSTLLRGVRTLETRNKEANALLLEARRLVLGSQERAKNAEAQLAAVRQEERERCRQMDKYMLEARDAVDRLDGLREHTTQLLRELTRTEDERDEARRAPARVIQDYRDRYRSEAGSVLSKFDEGVLGVCDVLLSRLECALSGREDV